MQSKKQPFLLRQENFERMRRHPLVADSEGMVTAASASTPLLAPPSLRETSVTFGGSSVAGTAFGSASASVAATDATAAAADQVEARYVRRRMRENPMWSLDRGSGRNDADRKAFRKASLLSTGM